MGLQMDHSLKLIGDRGKFERAYRPWYLVIRDLKFGQYDEDVGVGWNATYGRKCRRQHKSTFILTLSTAQSLAYDSTIGQTDDDPEITPYDEFKKYYKRLEAFYDKKREVDRITLDCNISIPSAKRQPKLFEFLLPDIWAKYGMYDIATPKSKKIASKRKELKSLLIQHLLRNLKDDAKIKRLKRELDLLKSEFYKDYETIFSDIWNYIKKMDTVAHLFRGGFIVTIKMLTNFAETFSADLEKLDEIDVLYHLYPRINIRPAGKTFRKKGVFPDEAGELKETGDEKKFDKYDREIIGYDMYCIEEQRLKKCIKGQLSQGKYDLVYKEIIKRAIEDFNIFATDFFGDEPIKDALHLLVYKFYYSIAKEVISRGFAIECPQCSKLAYKRRKDLKYCSHECRNRFNAAKDYRLHLSARKKVKLKAVRKSRKQARVR